MGHADVIERAREVLLEAAATLVAAGARREALGVVVVPRRILGVQRSPRIERVGEVFRLGVLLLEPDGTAHELGTTTRVTEPGRPQHLAASVERRRAERAAAIAGGFAIGEVVNHGTARIDLDVLGDLAASRLGLHGDAIWVRWGVTASERTPLAAYVSDQVDLLVHPPAGA